MVLPEFHSLEELAALAEELGYLPFFKNEIPGFSVEECCPPELWFTDRPGPWDWKGPVIQKNHCAYGKFFRGRALFVAERNFPAFCNFRRNGYDYDARMEDGEHRLRDVPLMKALWDSPSLLSGELKARVITGETAKKQFEGSLTALQMQTYIQTENFEYKTDKNGRPYGWGLARYTTPEAFFRRDFCDWIYTEEPEASAERVVEEWQKLTGESAEKLKKLLKGV